MGDLRLLLQQITMLASSDQQAAFADLHRVQQEISASKGDLASVLNGNDAVTEETVVADLLPASQGSVPPDFGLVPLPPNLLMVPKPCTQTPIQNTVRLFHSSAPTNAAPPPGVVASCKAPQVSFRVGGNDASHAAEAGALHEE